MQKNLKHVMELDVELQAPANTEKFGKNKDTVLSYVLQIKRACYFIEL